MSEKNITQKDVEYVAKLARVEITSEEKQKYQAQLENILDYVSQLKEVETGNAKSTAHPHDVSNVLREDKARTFPKIDAVLKNAPEKEGTFYRVKKVIET